MSIIEDRDYKIEILHEDEKLIFLNKPSGLLVHPYKAETNEKINLLKIVRDYLGAFVYPVHRLDRPVSGVIVFGKSSEAAKELQDIWHSGVQKKYLALVRGITESAGEFNFELNNENKVPQTARTAFKVVKYYSEATLVDIEIYTGRKHQIRRHFSRRMHQLIGDTRYGKGRINHYYRDNFGLNRIFLHSNRLLIRNFSGKQNFDIVAPLPFELTSVLEKLAK